MSFQLTATELAFAVPGGVLAGALVALWGVGRTNKANYKRAHAEKVWDKRSSLYVEVIGHLRSIDAEMNFLPRVGGSNANGLVINKLDRDIAGLEALESNIDAYASEEVRKMVTKWMETFTAAFSACHDLDNYAQSAKGQEAAPLIKKARSQAGNLKKRMRDELQGNSSR